MERLFASWVLLLYSSRPAAMCTVFSQKDCHYGIGVARLEHALEEHAMVTVKELLVKKGPQVFSISKNATVLNAAILMNDHRVGALVVIDEGHIQGMFSERDVLRRIVAERRDPATTLVQD